MLRNQTPPYEKPPAWIPPDQRFYHADYNNDLEVFLPRNVMLRRSGFSDSLGFNIRGGIEYHCGLYISRVMPNSNADKMGLSEGDQILKVNDVDFQSIDHSEAVRILKSYLDIHMIVKHFPYGYKKTYERNESLSPVSSPHDQIDARYLNTQSDPRYTNNSQYGQSQLYR